jgi:hypothetical protein
MRSAFVILTAIFVLFTFTAVAQKVHVDVDNGANFSKFKTYDFSEGQIARNPMITQLITNAIEGELRARGLTRNTTSPDLKIAVMAAAGMDLQGVGPMWNNQSYKSWGGYGNPASLMNVTTGTLLIDLLETTNNYSIFRGVSSETLNSGVTADPAKDARGVEKNVKKAVTKIFKKYPVSRK